MLGQLGPATEVGGSPLIDPTDPFAAIDTFEVPATPIEPVIAPEPAPLPDIQIMPEGTTSFPDLPVIFDL